jgi:hypothetical protein
MTEKKAVRNEKRWSLFLLLLVLGSTELEGKPRLLRRRRRRHLQENLNLTLTLEGGDQNITTPLSNSSQPLSSLSFPPTVSPTPPPCAVANEKALECGASPDDGNGDGPVAEGCCDDHGCIAGNTVCTVKIKAPIGGMLKPGIVGGISGTLTKPGREPASDGATTVGNITTNGTEVNATNTTGRSGLTEEIGESGISVGLAFLLIFWGIVMGCVMRTLSWC